MLNWADVVAAVARRRVEMVEKYILARVCCRVWLGELVEEAIELIDVCCDV